MKTAYKLFLLLLCTFALPIFPQSDSLQPTPNHRQPDLSGEVERSETKRDYRNHLNLPAYDPSLMPLKTVRSGTGVWTELNPKVPRVDYLGIHFINKDTGWACGANGVVIKTTNGGVSWMNINSQTTTPILKVRSFNGETVIASGYNGLVLRSTDGGETFTQISSEVTGDLWGLQMLNDTLGWACGNRNSLIKTTDGGLTWQRVITPGYTSDYWWIEFLNENYGFIAANGKVLRTTNGGTNWEIIQAGDSYPLFCIDVIDSLHIASAGYGGTGYPAKNIYSSDGGNSWINGFGWLPPYEINCIQYISQDTGYFVMSNYGIAKTTNRGQSWLHLTGDIGEYELALLASNIGYSAGTTLKLNKAEGNFDNWRELIINDNFVDVFFVSTEKGFVISPSYEYGQLYRTSNSGISWNVVSGAPSGNDLLFLDSTTGFIASDKIYKTTNGGISWYATNGITNIIAKIFFVNPQIGWAAGGYRIFKTIDGGENWIEQLFNSVAGFRSIFFTDSLNGWTANADRPYKTTSGGVNWIMQTNLNIWESRDIFFNNYLNGFILESNKLYESTDAGVSWVLNPYVTGFSVAARFSYSSDSIIFVTGYTTYRTINYGLDWIKFNELDGIRINGLSLLGASLGYAVGESGIVLRYYDEAVPVELMSFTAMLEGNNVFLNWITATETNNQGFNVERKIDGEFSWKTIAFIKGAGTSTIKNNYSFNDELLFPGKYIYRLKQIDYNGQYEYSNEIEVQYVNKFDFHLSQNYPNPFNPSTKINFNVPEKTYIKIILFDLIGREIKKIIEQEMEAGYYTVQLNSEGLSTGVYFYKMITGGGYTAVKKLTILK